MAAFELTFSSILLGTVGLLVAALLANAVYNLFFHPLRHFPGPLLHRASRLPAILERVNGSLARDVLRYHNKYGPVVRIKPDQLAFLDPDAWKDIYGHRTGSLLGADEMPKSPLVYRSKGVAPSLLSESRENHSLLRRQLSHGFSEQSMRDQEPIIGSYVNLLIKRLREHCAEEVYTDDKKTGTKPKALDMKTWYNWTTFDIIGDLAFGESFGCLENASYHPWVSSIANAVETGAYHQALKEIGLESLMPVLGFIFSGLKAHRSNTEQMLKRRMAAGSRPDLIEGLLRKQADWNIDFGRLRSNAGILVIAGSETTSTLLAGATFLLLKNPDKLKQLTKEVRSTFNSDDEITLTSVGSLTYMLKCLKESLRMYPPVAGGLPRVVPKGGAKIAGAFVPEDTAVACWQLAMNYSSRNFQDPFTFNPERHTEGGSNTHDRLDALQPFSVGPRNCIGRNLAYAEMRLILAKILFNFDLELVNPNINWIENQKVYVLWSKPELDVYLTPVR